ncbi:DUF6054 family protein [Nocardioides sp. J54]|uniref:DUF6054 family protein n=1 Tax=Nocardioides sp. J54 TaxID=935866 RepID=UPI00048B036E|nr:DUF6054 family protein [Nocardioides sp. J54]
MAHLARRMTGDPDALVAHLDAQIMSGSVSASRELAHEHRIGDARMLVRVYERYSATGGNRVSLCFSILAVGDELEVTAVTAGGSRATFFKMNTLGEGSFLDRARKALDDFRG